MQYSRKTMCHFPSLPVGGTKGRNHKRLRLEQFTGNSNGMRKWRVTVTILITKGIRNDPQRMPPKINNTRLLCLPRFLHYEESLIPWRESLSPAPDNDVKWYRITSCLATAKINLVLDGTRMVYMTEMLWEQDLGCLSSERDKRN